MFTICTQLKIKDKISLLVEGDVRLLKQNSCMIDDNGNIFKIISIGMTKFNNRDDNLRYANILISDSLQTPSGHLSILDR